MKSPLNPIKSIFIFLTILILNGCPKDNPVNPIDDSNLKFGVFTEYKLSGGRNFRFDDSLTGGTLIFPNGINGKVRIARIISGIKDSLPEGQGFVFEIDTEIPMLIELKGDSEYMPDAFIYSPVTYSTFEAISGKHWISLPPFEKKTNYIIYDLVSDELSFNAENKKNDNHILNVFTKIKLWFTQKKVSNLFLNQTKTEVDNNQKNMFNYVISYLSHSLKDYVLTKANSAEFSIKGSIANKNSSAYRAYRSSYFNKDSIHPGFVLHPHFNWNIGNVSENTLAHETGHYLSHLIVGDKFFYVNMAKSYNQDYHHYPWPKDNHEFGQINPNKPMMEEWAYFIENMIKGELKGSSKTGGGGVKLRDAREYLEADPKSSSGKLHHPRNCNWIEKEGYIAFLLTQMVDTYNPIYIETIDTVVVREHKPIILMSYAEVFDVLHQSPPIKSDDIYRIFGDYLKKKSNEDFLKFTALLEKTGWSYNGNIKVLNSSGEPSNSVIVKNVVQVSQNEVYYAGIQNKSTDGVYNLNRLFPGESSIRVIYERNGKKDSADYVIYIDPKRPTNKTIDMIEIKLPSEPPKYKQIQLTFHLPCNKKVECYNQVNTTSDFFFTGTSCGIGNTFDAKVKPELMINKNIWTAEWEQDQIHNDNYIYKGKVVINVINDNTFTFNFSLSLKQKNGSGTGTFTCVTKQISFENPGKTDKYVHYKIRKAFKYYESVSGQISEPKTDSPVCTTTYIDFKDGDNAYIEMTLYY